MKKAVIGLLIMFSAQFSYAAWINLNTGINDNLTGVVFWGNNGLVTGEHGLYYTTNGGNGSASWTRFNITNNSADSILYNNIKFTCAFGEIFSTTSKAYVCGYDTVTNKAIIMDISIASLSYNIIYIGPTNSQLKNISFHNYSNSYYAVGNNGLFVKFNSTSYSNIIFPYNYNLLSISFNGSYFSMGSNGHVINGNINNLNVITYYNDYVTPNNNYKSVICTGYNGGFGVGNSYFEWTSSLPYNFPNYDFGPLNGKAIFKYINKYYVGTDHGIFKSGTPSAYLEWQPSSLNYNINSFCNGVSGNSFLYACGKNGVLLYTGPSDEGGPSKPYAKLDISGGCVGSSMTFYPVTGTSTSCKWYINNVLTSSNCGSLSQVFNTVGQYTVELNVSSGINLYDTAIQVINIVNIPKKNKPTITNKNILCQQEPIVITIDSSQLNVFYTLRKIGNILEYGNSGSGNLSSISFTSSVLSTTGNYFLVAKSSLAECIKNFTDTIKIKVEKTRADFHSASINASTGENVNLYQKCADSQNFSWKFTNDANILSSNASNPNLSFSLVGQKNVKLVSWSNNGCYDSIQKKAVTIYISPSVDDSCWTIVNNGPQTQYNGNNYGLEAIDCFSSSKSGFLAGGITGKETHCSHLGDSLSLDSTAAIYVAKYNKYGVLKWMNYSLGHENNTGTNLDRMKSIVEDKNGNIYSCGSGSIIFDNRGDKIRIINNNFAFANYLMKMDSTGKVIWTFVSNMIPEKVNVDKSNNVYIIGPTQGSVTTPSNTVIGTQTYTYSNIQSNGNFQILKISPNGQIMWVNSLNMYQNNDVGLKNLAFDSNNNIYLTGKFENSVKYYNAPGNLSITTTTSSAYSSIFLAKYDSTGVFQWKVISNDATVLDLKTDSEGNSYISGSNECYSQSSNQIFENSDGSFTSSNSGTFYISKINKNGICKWIQGNISSYYGLGNAIDLQGNEVSVLGYISENPQSMPITNVFNSANQNNLNLTISPSDYFIAVYDTIGNIKKIISNGNNNWYPNGPHGVFRNFFRIKGSNEYVLAQEILIQGPYENFGDTLPPMNGYHGAITKISENCGYIVYPSQITNLNQSNIQKYLIYPNPVDNNLFVNTKNDIKNINFQLINSLGQHFEITHKDGNIDLEYLKPGIYFLLIYKDNKLVQQEKLIKE